MLIHTRHSRGIKPNLLIRLPFHNMKLATGFFVCWFAFPIAADPPVSVRVKPLQTLAIYPQSSAPARVVSRNDSSLASAINGLILEIPAKVGNQVKAGTPLVKLDCKAFELERTRLEAEKQSLLAKKNLSEWQLKQAQTLAEQQTLPEEQVQEKRSQLAVISSDIEAYRAKIEVTSLEISHCVVKAPFDGVVTARLAAVGQYASQGTALIKLLDLTQPEISAQVPVSDIEGLQKAIEPRLEINGQLVSVQLRSILPVIHTESGTQEVRLNFNQTQQPPGAAGRLIWQTDSPHIAPELLVKRNDNLGVFIVDRDIARFHALPAALGGRPSAIDLPKSTLIVVSGQFSLQDGVAVKAEP